ncbi:MAG: YkvA family protein [Culicoidibacterales bacterium]
MNHNQKIAQTMAQVAPTYSEAKFSEKVSDCYKVVEAKVLYWALLAYYGFNSSDTPLAAKIQIVGALAYFIMPFDIIPDVLPVVGYGDDLAALAIALTKVAASIGPAVQKQAQIRTMQLRPTVKHSDIQGFNQEIGL